MKKYITGFLVLGIIVLGGFTALKVEAGALTGAQISNVLNLLQQYGVSASTQSSVQSVLSSTNATGSTTSTTNYTNGCTGGYIFNIYTGAPCPTTAAGTTSTTTNTTNTTTTNSNNNTTTNTTTTTTNTTTNTGNNGCYSNQTNVYAYNIQNGAQCVKACPTVVSASNNNMNYWNVVTNSMCPAYVPPPQSSVSVTVLHPNGGESFDQGETIGLKWETEGISSNNEKVFLLLNYYTPEGTFITNTKLLDTLTINDGAEQVKLPTTLPSGASWGNNFRVTVGVESIATDMSDKNFIIQ